MPLMTYEEYAKIEYEHEIPYTFILNYDPNYLFYFGEEHSYDPSDKQWAIENNFWLEFIKKTDEHKRIVFVEGGIRPVETTEEESIRKYGGMGFVTYLASKNSIDTYSPEPNQKEQRVVLEKSFSKKEIQYYFFARQIPQWHRHQNPKLDFEKYINVYLEGQRKSSGWVDFDFSLDSMKKIHKEIFETNFNQDDVEFFSSITTPVELRTVVNKVARSCSNIRNVHIVSEIQKYLNNGYSVYVQYGCTHAIMQEPLLRELIKA